MRSNPLGVDVTLAENIEDGQNPFRKDDKQNSKPMQQAQTILRLNE